MNSRPIGGPRLYDDPRWRAESRAFLRRNPYCAFCAQRGQMVRSRIVDHDPPHRGDPARFWDRSTWSPLCKHCHDSAKQRQERLGRVIGCDAEGMPLDPGHHWNGGVGRPSNAIDLRTGSRLSRAQPQLKVSG